MTRATRALAISIAVLLLLGLASAALVPLRQVRNDVNDQQALLSKQLATAEEQLRVLRDQLAIATTTRDSLQRNETQVAQLLSAAQSLLATTRGAATDVHSTAASVAELRSLTMQLLAVSRELETLLRRTEEHVASIDAKTG